MLEDITLVPETLSSAQHDMNERNPGANAPPSRMLAFHRYNVEMFRLAGEQLVNDRSGDDWPGWCFDLQLKAVAEYARRIEDDSSSGRHCPCRIPAVASLLRVPPMLRFGEWMGATAVHMPTGLDGLAERTGLAPDYVKRVCSGRSSVRSLATVAAVADALGQDREVAAVLALRDLTTGFHGLDPHDATPTTAEGCDAMTPDKDKPDASAEDRAGDLRARLEEAAETLRQATDAGTFPPRSAAALAECLDALTERLPRAEGSHDAGGSE
ncbi:helix-turn-helix domain-containing protein [Amycolatopsis rubida]|uniref:Helix-turn-helix domain-containing protein n=1 Tax=Amycolatopsis rubida TaxID=112413 RepID=A0ABX0BHX9_9PSEU|nr:MULTISPECIES: helix-turn-helix transcriptional regulator [Amycolatopsis]MYW90020.1 helix-turn-helix domain-containing protein [Amycolatopsis rubida]NEC54997.1 helix-turn-helix domain-containing protein [Amycolatopsis rubida]OAP29035.1 hypothetical protein A4R44_00829 [Amycolatopsis sp. M39]